MSKLLCKIEDCDRSRSQGGLCGAHWRRQRDYGDPLDGPPIRKTVYVPRGLTVRERFVMFAKPVPSGCWEWQGHLDDKGYGRMVIRGKIKLVHRVSMAMAGRTIPPGLEADHLCRNPRCAHPWHLDIVTRAENNRRKIRPTICPQGHAKSDDNVYVEKGRRHCKTCTKEAARRSAAKRPPAPPRPLATHCGKGHEFTPENTYLTRGSRRCRVCNRVRQRRYKERVRAARWLNQATTTEDAA